MTPTLASVRFLGIDIDVAGNVLRPRAETELLAREALSLLDENVPSRCIDMCCGSGNLAVALATNRPAAEIWASDLTDDAVAATRRNVEQLVLGDRVHVVQGDMFAALSGGGLEGTIDMVVANPPYISTHRLLEGEGAHLLHEEPREAFDGGPYGIALHQRLIAEAPSFLKEGGWLGMEFGLGQARQIATLVKRARIFGEVRWSRNEEGEDRVVFLRKGAPEAGA